MTTGDGKIFQEKMGIEEVSPKQVENLNRVFKTIAISGVYLNCSKGANCRSGTALGLAYMGKAVLTALRLRKSVTVTMMSQGVSTRHFESLIMGAGISIESLCIEERKSFNDLASLEQDGQLQDTATNARGEFALALISAGLALGHPSTYRVPLI